MMEEAIARVRACQVAMTAEVLRRPAPVAWKGERLVARAGDRYLVNDAAVTRRWRRRLAAEPFANAGHAAQQAAVDLRAVTVHLDGRTLTGVEDDGHITLREFYDALPTGLPT